MRLGLLLCGQLSAMASAANDFACEREIQKQCWTERAGPNDKTPNRTDEQACMECAEQNKADLQTVCTAETQVKQFCKSTKPVIGGYDVVQYFSLEPHDLGVLGSPEFAQSFTSPDADGSLRFKHEFWFANEQNRAKFAADPWKYAPKNGGF